MTKAIFKKDKSLVVSFIIVLFLSSFYFYKNYKKLDINDPKEIVSLVEKIIVLPKNEVPTVATVSDLEKLKGQEFFTNANIGDKVLIYTKAGKAILYSPKEHMIINVAPLSATSSKNMEPRL